MNEHTAQSVAGSAQSVAGSAQSVAGSAQSVAGNAQSVAGSAQSVAGNAQSVAIFFASKHGATADACRALAKALATHGIDAQVTDLAQVRRADVDVVRPAVLAAPIYAGAIHGRLIRFCNLYELDLRNRPLWLMVSCMISTDKVPDIVAAALPAGLVARMEETPAIGGRIRLAELTLIERFVAKNFAKVTADVDTLDHAGIQALAGRIAAELDNTE